MNAIRLLAVSFVLTITLIAPLAAHACPLCSEAIASANDANDKDNVDNFPAAMNQSIYLMIGVPYAAFGIVGFMVYRGMRQNDEFRKQHGETDPPIT